MSECIIDTERIGSETKDYAVFYATHDFIIYKDQKKIKMMGCDDKLMTEIDCPADYRSYDCLDYGDGILFIFAGKTIVFLDKSGFEPQIHEIDIERLGRIITKPVKSQNKNAVIFGTASYGQIQFVNYDFFGKKRLSQTQSWKMREVTDITSDGNLLFSIFDNTFLTSCKAETGECLWTRFENAAINGKLLPYKGKLLYNCQSLVRAADEEGNVDNISIPTVQVSSLEHIIGDRLFLTFEQNKKVCCYNLKDKQIIWQLNGRLPINESISIKGRYQDKIHDILVVRMGEDIGVISLTIGRVVNYFRSPGAFKIRQTGDHILIHRRSDRTDIIPGE